MRTQVLRVGKDGQSALESGSEVRERMKIRRATLAQETDSNSARYEYATGTTSSANSKQSVRPPIIVTAIDARCSEPAPIPIATGINPATIESVVIKIGRKRTRFASRIASRTGVPLARRRFV